jgi:hypothetical protein
MIWAQPSPSFGGWPSAKQPRDLRLCDSAPSALAPPTRRWRGNLRFRWTGASSRQGARPQPAAFRGCSVRAGAHLLARRAGMLRQAFGRDRIPPSRPRSRRVTSRCSLRAFGLNSPPALRSRLSSFISELASHEVSGFGAIALPPALGLEVLTSASAIARDHGVSASGWRWRSLPPAATATCWQPSAETWPSLPVQRHPRGSNRVGEEGRANEELSESPGQRPVRPRVRLSGSGSR